MLIIASLSILSISVIVIILYLFIKSRIEISILKKKYGSIIDVDLERTNIQKEITDLMSERKNLKDKFNDEKEKLTFEYNNAHMQYETLRKELSLLEESLELTEFGVYKPHFDFDAPEQYKQEIEAIYEQEKALIKADKAVKCDTEWTVSGSKVEGKKMIRQHSKLMLRAFNGECDAALMKVRWDNALKMEERIKKAFEIINKSGEVNKIHITRECLDLKLKELRLTYEYQEKVKEEKEEQRRIQEEMREEEKARRELEKAKEEAEKEERRYQIALEKVRAEAEKTTGAQLNVLNGKISDLEGQLKAAQEQKERAISRAQLTKSGHIYIISNIGSFGETTFKIGMTRRLEPLDRIKELGDASVPFPFDVHALIYSENAPELEYKLHSHFSNKCVNLVNSRKEFFTITIDDLLSWAGSQKIDIKITKLAEAREYRESLAMRAKGETANEVPIKKEIPTSIGSMFSKDDE
jgi:hypothetical protein